MFQTLLKKRSKCLKTGNGSVGAICEKYKVYKLAGPQRVKKNIRNDWSLRQLKKDTEDEICKVKNVCNKRLPQFLLHTFLLYVFRLLCLSLTGCRIGSVSSRECLDAPAILATFTAGRTGLVIVQTDQSETSPLKFAGQNARHNLAEFRLSFEISHFWEVFLEYFSHFAFFQDDTK